MRSESLERYLAAILLSCCLLPACAAPTIDEKRSIVQSRLQNPAESFWLTVESEPSGADVYGLVDGQPATRLGTTPLTLKYTYTRDTGLWGSRPEETLSVEFESSKLILDKGSARVTFRCAIAKAGYKTTIVDRLIGEKRAMAAAAWKMISDILNGNSETVTASLEPLVAGRKKQDPAPPQQQEQPTVIAPQSAAPQGGPSRGTVMIVSEPEHGEVYVDGAFVGNAPADLKLRDGTYIVEVRKEGYTPFRKELRVFGDSEVTLRAVLKR
jgi:hypothetical protein